MSLQTFPGRLLALAVLLAVPVVATADDVPSATVPAAVPVAAVEAPVDRSAPAVGAAADKPAPAVGVTTGSELRSASLRMTAGLAAVLALLGGVAWLSRRFRVTAGMRGGPIEVLSGISLGTREKVVLLRVGREQVLVGVSATGMRTLHVLDPRNPTDFQSLVRQEPA